MRRSTKKGRPLLFNHVRGLSPYPAAWTSLTLSSGEVISPVKVYKVTPLNSHSSGNPGEMITDGKTFIDIVCADGAVALEELQIPGKKRMDVKSLLNGFKL